MKKARNSYRAVVTNRGPDTVLLNKIETTDSKASFIVGEPLHRDDLELLPLSRHEFLIAPSLADAQPLEVDITFTDATGTRTKTYPMYL